MTKYPDKWHIFTDTTAQVNKRAEASNQGGPLAITKLDMQQKSMITMMENISVALLVQLGLGSIDEWDNLPVLSGHLEEVMIQKLLRRPALVNVHLRKDFSFWEAEMHKK